MDRKAEARDLISTVEGLTFTVPSLSRKIKDFASEIGFSKVGIARVEELTEEGHRLKEWLNRGYHGTMDWMVRAVEKRVDVQSILPGARSVICVAMNYYTPSPHPDRDDVGKISRYAWGDDYHLMMTKRLERLQEFVRIEVPGVNAKLYVDTGPVMEKAWAVRAGLGWMGKHTNVITKEYGSWVFLGEIIIDFGLEYDEPIADFCGSCRACQDACPTNALSQEYVLDSTKCISYLTIEHKGEMPGELTPKFERWIYGCDICQDVCPWNKFQRETAEPSFQPRVNTLEPKLADLAELTKEEFKDRFRKSPIKRTKWEGLMRNVRAVREHLPGKLKVELGSQKVEE